MIEQKGAFGSKKFARYVRKNADGTEEKMLVGIQRPNRGRRIMRLRKVHRKQLQRIVKVEPPATPKKVGFMQRIKQAFTQKKGG